MSAPLQGCGVSPAESNPLPTCLQTIIDKKVGKITDVALTCFESFVHWFLTTFSCFYPAYGRFYNDAKITPVNMQPVEQAMAPTEAPSISGNTEAPLPTVEVEIKPEAPQLTEEELRLHRESLLERVSANPELLPNLDDPLAEDETFLLDAIEKNGVVFKYVKRNIKAALEFEEAAISRNVQVYNQLDSYTLAQWIAQKESVQPFLDAGILLSEETILESLIGDSAIFCTLSEELQNDPVFILKAIEKNPRVFTRLSAEFKENRDFIEEVIRRNCLALEWVGEALQDDAKIVALAVAQDGKTLKFASARLSDDPATVKLAVQQCSAAFEFATSRCQKNGEIENTFLETMGREAAEKQQRIQELWGS